LRGIEYVYDECPHSVGSKTIYYKELLNQLEQESAGAKLQFYLSFLRAKSKDGLFAHAGEQVVLNPCERCGQPTSAPGTCAFCRLWDRIAKVKEAAVAI
jgi:tRNA(Ile)-lysidine synthase TilS/MesJ